MSRHVPAAAHVERGQSLGSGSSPEHHFHDSPQDLRDTLGRFATGVTVVSAVYEGLIHGATVGSFTSISLTPPLILVSVGRGKRLAHALAAAGPFIVNILGAHQAHLARHFAGTHRLDPADGIVWELTDQGPSLDGAVARLACRPWAQYDGGDHVIFVGRVVAIDGEGGPPLISHRGALAGLDYVREETS